MCGSGETQLLGIGAVDRGQMQQQMQQVDEKQQELCSTRCSICEACAVADCSAAPGVAATGAGAATGAYRRETADWAVLRN